MKAGKTCRPARRAAAWETAAARLTRQARPGFSDVRQQCFFLHLVVLRAVRGDLDRAQAVAEGGAAGHGPALLQAVEQRAAPGVAAAGRVGNLVGGRGGNALALAAFPDVAAFAAQGEVYSL